VLFLVAAAVDPVYRTSESRKKIVIIFDNSAYMNIKNNSGKTQFDQAYEKLNYLIDTTGINQRIAIICTVDSEQFSNAGSLILTDFTYNKKYLKQKIATIRNTNIPSNLNDSLKLAAKLIELDDFSYNNSASPDDIDSNDLSDSRILVCTANPNLSLDKKEHADSKSSERIQNTKIEYCLFGRAVGETYNNVAITRFQSRLLFDDLSGYELFVELSNFGDGVVETRLRIFVGERLSDVVSVLLQPHEVKPYFIKGKISESHNNFRQDQSNSLRSPLANVESQNLVHSITENSNESKLNRSGIFETKNVVGEVSVVIRGEIEINDCFEADNKAYTILPLPELQNILYFGVDNFFLINALKSYISQSRRQSRFERVVEIPDVVPLDSVLVINQSVPLKLPVGNVLIFDPRSGCELFGIDGLFPSPLVIGFESGDSHLIKFTQLLGKELSGIGKIKLPESIGNKTPEILLATVENYPVYLSWNFRNENKSYDADSEIRTTNSEKSDWVLNRVLVFAADISRFDLVFRLSFPVLVGNALNYFRGVGDELEWNYFVGESVILNCSYLNFRSQPSAYFSESGLLNSYTTETHNTRSINLDIGVDWVKIKSPSGESKILPVYSDSNLSKGKVYIGKLSEVGVYEFFGIVSKDRGSIDANRSSRMIWRLACNFGGGEKKFTDRLQDNIKSLEGSIVQIPKDNQRSIYNFNNFQFYFLFTICALLLLICNWQIGKI
jgi:hypothetical protein